MILPSSILRGCICTALAIAAGCGGSSSPNVTPPAAAPQEEAVKPVAIAKPAPDPLPEITFEDNWRGTSFGAILLPQIAHDAKDANDHSYIRDDGAVDVAFHFHGAQMAGKSWRAAKLNAIVASATWGIGSHAYRDKLADASVFPAMIDETLKTASAAAGRPLHLGRLMLVAWSAGYGGVEAILEKDQLYKMVDAVVLLDGLHADYKEPVDAGMPRDPSPENVDLTNVKALVRFAGDAVAGRTAMVITHSSIVPPDYASTTETTSALLLANDVPSVTVDEAMPREMHLVRKADKGNLHVRGYRGEAAHDHVQQLSLVGEEVLMYILPRWAKSVQ